MKQLFKSAVSVALAMMLSINFVLFQSVAVNAEEVQETEIIEEVDATPAEEVAETEENAEVSETTETDGEESETEFAESEEESEEKPEGNPEEDSEVSEEEPIDWGDISEEIRTANNLIDVPEGFWCYECEETVLKYNGKAQQIPEENLKIFNDNRLLKLGEDYSVKCSNNTNASTDEKPATYTVTFKGNYAGSLTGTFKIHPNDLANLKGCMGNNSLSGTDKVFYSYNGKKQQYKPVLKATVDGNVYTLKENKDYYLTYAFVADGHLYTDKDYVSAVLNAYIMPGNYKISIHGMNNYCGTVVMEQEIVNCQPISKATITGIKNLAFSDGEPVEQQNMVVKMGKTILNPGVDYTVSYKDNTQVGTATVTITGVQESGYIGTKSATFKINGTALNRAKITGIKAMTYTGGAITLPELSLTYQASKKSEIKTLNGCSEFMYSVLGANAKRAYDYTYSYSNNINKGKAKLVLKGVNGFTGIVAKNFDIKQLKVTNDIVNANMLKMELPESVQYVKGGAKPKPVIVHVINHENVTLTEGKDYTLSYTNNAAVNDRNNPKKLPSVKVNFKGNYTGSISGTFSISPSSIKNATATAADKVITKPTKFAKPTITVKDADGTKLVANKDYDFKNIRYYIASTNEEITTGYMITPGTDVRVVIKGLGNYAGDDTISCTYKYAKASLSKTSFKIADYKYTGREIRPSYEDFKVKLGNTVLDKEDYDISYSNNINVGKGKVTITGKGNYIGSKTVEFKIAPNRYSPKK